MQEQGPRTGMSYMVTSQQGRNRFYTPSITYLTFVTLDHFRVYYVILFFFFFTPCDLTGTVNYISSHSKIYDVVGRSEIVNKYYSQFSFYICTSTV